MAEIPYFENVFQTYNNLLMVINKTAREREREYYYQILRPGSIAMAYSNNVQFY